MRGDVILWEQNIRFKHMCTRKYLCLENDRLSLSSESDNKNIVFRLKPVLKGGLTIEYGLFAILEHTLTERYFHGEGTSKTFKTHKAKPKAAETKTFPFFQATQFYEYNQNKTDADTEDPMMTLKWETTKGRQVSVSKTPRFDDAFAILPIEPEYIVDFNTVAGIIPTMDQYVKLVQKTSARNLSAKNTKVNTRCFFIIFGVTDVWLLLSLSMSHSPLKSA